MDVPRSTLSLSVVGLSFSSSKLVFGTTSGRQDKALIKPGVTILAEVDGSNEAKYIHGKFGRGTWTFFGGHDPEDYQHMVGDPPTDLALHPHSPGYRLILNNVLFPAAKKQPQKT